MKKINYVSLLNIVTCLLNTKIHAKNDVQLFMLTAYLAML